MSSPLDPAKTAEAMVSHDALLFPSCVWFACGGHLNLWILNPEDASSQSQNYAVAPLEGAKDWISDSGSEHAKDSKSSNTSLAMLRFFNLLYAVLGGQEHPRDFPWFPTLGFLSWHEVNTVINHQVLFGGFKIQNSWQSTRKLPYRISQHIIRIGICWKCLNWSDLHLAPWHFTFQRTPVKQQH